MPPKKKAKRTQTVSLDKRKQAKLLRDKASAFEAEATVEERIHELLKPAKISANTFLLKVFHEKASAEGLLSHKKKAYLDAGFAIKEYEYKIRSGEDAMELKGVGKSSASLIDKAMEEGGKVAEKFFDVLDGKVGLRKAIASLPKDAELCLDNAGVLRVNNKCREDFHARGCPYTVDGYGLERMDDFGPPFVGEYIVDGTANYNGFSASDQNAYLKFSGRLTFAKKRNFGYKFSFNYYNDSMYGDYIWKDIPTDLGGEVLEQIAATIVSRYEWSK